jgi:hypothetical protein
VMLFDGGSSRRCVCLILHCTCYIIIVLLLFLQKQNLANAIYLFGLGTLLLNCSRGGRGIVEDMCYERRRAEARPVWTTIMIGSPTTRVRVRPGASAFVLLPAWVSWSVCGEVDSLCLCRRVFHDCMSIQKALKAVSQVHDCRVGSDHRGSPHYPSSD